MNMLLFVCVHACVRGLLIVFFSDNSDDIPSAAALMARRFVAILVYIVYRHTCVSLSVFEHLRTRGVYGA